MKKKTFILKHTFNNSCDTIKESFRQKDSDHSYLPKKCTAEKTNNSINYVCKTPWYVPIKNIKWNYCFYYGDNNKSPYKSITKNSIKGLCAIDSKSSLKPEGKKCKFNLNTTLTYNTIISETFIKKWVNKYKKIQLEMIKEHTNKKCSKSKN